MLIAIAGAVAGNWFVVAAMVLLAVSQIINYRANRDRTGDDANANDG